MPICSHNSNFRYLSFQSFSNLCGYIFKASRSSFFCFRVPFLFFENLIPNLCRHCVYMYVPTGQKCHTNAYGKFHAFPHPKSYFLIIFTYSDQWFMFLFPQLQIFFFEFQVCKLPRQFLSFFCTISSHIFPLNFSLIKKRT